MTVYRISGIWKNASNSITHYAFHVVKQESVSRATKIAKYDAIQLLEKANTMATTWVWNYVEARWNIGEEVSVVNGINGKFLRSNPDRTVTDNLAHLIDYDWIKA